MNEFLKGPYAVLLMPFKGAEIDEESFIAEIKRINGTGISGLVVNGSTAEFTKLTLAQQLRAVELCVKYAEKNKQIIVSACTSDASDTVYIAKKSKELGAHAILVCPPYYFKFTAKEREEFFLKVADNSPLPVVLYNIPFFSQELELEVIYRLFEHKNIIGIKDSSGSMKRLSRLVYHAQGKNVSILTGTDDIFVPALFAGCAGAMMAFGATFPDKVYEAYKAFNDGDYEKAKAIQREFTPLLEKADAKSFPFGYKELYEEVTGIKMRNKEIE